MNDVEHLDRRVRELEAELGETAAALIAATQRLGELEAALAASYRVQAAVADPKFEPTLEVERTGQVTRLRARNKALKARNRRLAKQYSDLRESRTFRWSAGVRKALGRLRGPRI